MTDSEHGCLSRLRFACYVCGARLLSKHAFVENFSGFIRINLLVEASFVRCASVTVLRRGSKRSVA